MSNINYPQPLSLKDDWKGWVVDHNIKPITTDLTPVSPRKNIPRPLAPFRFSTPSGGYSLSNPHMISGSEIDDDEISEARKTCVSPGIVDSLHPLSDDSCMMLVRELNPTESSSVYAGENSAQDATTKNLTDEYSKILDTGTYDLSNIKFIHNSENNPGQIYTDNVNASSRWTSDDMEMHSYIDVEKYNDDVYWNDYDIWDIKRLYKANHGQSEYKDRKIWWNNLYNPYCHDMYEWVDTGLRSNESTMRMTCGYKENGTSDIFDKNYVSHEISSNFTNVTGDYRILGNIHYYRGPHVEHPLNSILTNQIQNENGEMVNCEDCKNKAAVSWDKEDNGIITGFTGTLEDSTYTESELRDAFSKIIPPEIVVGSGMEDTRYYTGSVQLSPLDSRTSNPGNINAIEAGEPKLIPEIIGSMKSNHNTSNAFSPLREPVVVNITTTQAMRFCNENDDCAGFLHYRLPDNFDYIRNGNSNCEGTPDFIQQDNPGYRCFGTPDGNTLLHRLSGTLTANSFTPLDRIKNLFVFKKIIGSNDPDDENWGPNIEADELIRPNKYVYCKNGNMDPSIPEEYQNFKTDGLFESNSRSLLQLPSNKCAPFKSDTRTVAAGFQFNKFNENAVTAPPRDGGIGYDGICDNTPSNDGGSLMAGGDAEDAFDQIKQKRANSFLLERCRDKNLSPILEHVSGPESEMDTLLYRNLPAYVYKKRPRPDYTGESYKLKPCVTLTEDPSCASGGIYQELNAEADSKIQRVVDQITDRSQINDDYYVDESAFSCGDINDNYISKYHIIEDNNCTQECKNEIRWKALYKINNCDSETEASADCNCIQEARTLYSNRRDDCIKNKAQLKEYYLNKIEKQNLDNSWNYYKEGTAIDEWWTDTTAISGDSIIPSRIQHPSNIYLSSLGSNSLYDFTGISGLKDNWDGDGNDDNTFKGQGTDGMPTVVYEPISLTCCINNIDLDAASGGNIDASNFQQCMHCGNRDSTQCDDIVDHGIFPFTDTRATHPETQGSAGASGTTTTTSSANVNASGSGSNGDSNNDETSLFESFSNAIDDLIDYFKELLE